MSVIRNVLFTATRKSVTSLIKPKLRSLSSTTNILDSQLPDVVIPKVSIPELIYERSKKHESYTAIECGITGRKYTYGEIIKKSRNLGKSLRKLGLKEGDVVAVLLPNVPEFPLATIGALNAGLIVTTLNPIYTPDEIQRQLSDSSTKAIITIAELWPLAQATIKLLKKHLPIITIKSHQSQSLPQGAINFNELTDNVIDYPELKPSHPDDVAILPYSSGTTGLPKGVQLTHSNLVSNILQVNSPDLGLVSLATITHQDIVPMIMPMFHIYGLNLNLGAFTNGAKLVTLPKFTPEDYVAVLRKHKPHVLFLAPPLVLFLSGHPMVKKEDLQSVRATLCGSAPLGALDEQKFVEKAGQNVVMLQGYGLTETSPTVTAISMKLKSEKNVYGSIGRPVPNTLVKIINVDDPTGTPLGPNCKGELLVKGPQVMKGYLNKPEETEKTFLDGWLRTGDMVYYNEDKVLFITDRTKELIKVKGFQVAPAELEEVIRDFPGVDDAAVIGVSHPSQGEAPRAYIVAKKDKKVNVKDLEEYVKSKVANYKQLKGGIEIIDSIPKNAAGKILRRNLKLQYEEEQKKFSKN